MENAWHQVDVLAEGGTSVTAANSTWTNAPAIFTDVIDHRVASICPVGIIVAVSPVTEAPYTTAHRVLNVSTSTNATTIRSRGGTRVIPAQNASTPRVVTRVLVQGRITTRRKNVD